MNRSTSLAAALAVSALAVTALLNQRARRRTHAAPLPRHRFITVAGARLHYIDHGSGIPVVLLHGTGAMAEDFVLSGVFDRLARHYRVLAFDRPGFGYSPPTCGTPSEAELIHQALRQLGIERAVILGHSSGTLPALSIALDHPDHAIGIVLLSGYYFQQSRSDLLVANVLAAPLLRAVASHVTAHLFGWLLLPAYIRQVFAPQPPPLRFVERFPAAAVLRPSRLCASLRETLRMHRSAGMLQTRYESLCVPARILAGTADRIVTSQRQSAKLHTLLRKSEYRSIDGAGHMVHYIAPEQVEAAVASIAAGQTGQLAGV